MNDDELMQVYLKLHNLEDTPETRAAMGETLRYALFGLYYPPAYSLANFFVRHPRWFKSFIVFSLLYWLFLVVGQILGW